MTIKKISFLALSISSLVSMTANASVDARSSAMGDTGVASSNYLSAPFYNPALVAANYNDSDDFGLLLPALNVSASDKGDIIGSVDTFSEIDDQIKSDPMGAPAKKDEWVAALKDLDGKTLNANVQAGIAISIPNQYASVNLNTSANIDVYALANVDERDFEGDNYLYDDLASNVTMLAAGTADLGLTVAKSFNVKGHDIHVGVTPKYQKLVTMAYKASANDFDEDDITEDKYRTESAGFNLDLGVAYNPREDVEVGLVVKNVLSKELETSAESVGKSMTYKIKPEVTIGTAYQHEFFTVALDVDLTEKSGFEGIDYGKQFVKVGIEGDAWGWAQLRAGYKHNIKDSSDDMVTAGLGFHPFGAVGIDLVAGMGTDNTYTAGLQMNYTF